MTCPRMDYRVNPKQRVKLSNKPWPFGGGVTNAGDEAESGTVSGMSGTTAGVISAPASISPPKF